LVLFPEGPDPLERPSAAPVTPQAAASSAATGLMRVAHHN